MKQQDEKKRDNAGTLGPSTAAKTTGTADPPVDNGPIIILPPGTGKVVTSGATGATVAAATAATAATVAPLAPDVPTSPVPVVYYYNSAMVH